MNTKVIIIIIIFSFFSLAFLNTYFGWFADKKYEMRRYSGSINESKSRGVFNNQLNYKTEPDSLDISDIFFVEQSYTWGKYSSKKTNKITESEFKYQLFFDIRQKQYHLNIDRLKTTNTDSIGVNFVLLREPFLKDSIYINVYKQQSNNNSIKFDTIGKITVW